MNDLDIPRLLRDLQAGQAVAPTALEEALVPILSGEADDVQVAGLLVALAARPPAAVQGVTGSAGAGALGPAALVAAAAGVDVPLGLGFGLSRAEDLTEAFAAGAHIAVIGSALLRLVEREPCPGGLRAFAEACRQFAAAAQDAPVRTGC